MDKIENFIELCEKIDNVVYTNYFYPMSQIKKIQIKHIDFILKGINEESEKKLIAFTPKNYPREYISFPVKFFKIVKKSKFISLEHKHYLGTILSLGIKREILGDLIVKNEICYGIIIDNMFEFLKNNLIKINSSPVEVIEIEEIEVPISEFEEINITVSSARLDVIVAELANLSRTVAVEHVDLGYVQVNYEIEREKDFKLNVGDIIIIKKVGKFIFYEDKGLSKKNKMKLLIKKYI
ncbi:YlmH/Sll1252 family protein [Fusobacterium sp.]|uniref:YlmH/Sll1252 family protein n=1 Tax=Fusobacterium sp. TaxID=68766 RepID=UPI0025C58476|nr:YlmH/Sll1252 family protein [Fusobacterium sp.]MCI7223308.1 YlmH/Sll1252 family protein [Fusobacterium sp.]